MNTSNCLNIGYFDFLATGPDIGHLGVQGHEGHGGLPYLSAHLGKAEVRSHGW